MMVKQFLVFAGDNYYPIGGWEDFKGSFVSKEEAVGYTRGLIRGPTSPDWIQIVDTQTGEIWHNWERAVRERAM